MKEIYEEEYIGDEPDYAEMEEGNREEARKEDILLESYRERDYEKKEPKAKRVKVESSNIDFVFFNESKEELTVWFIGRKGDANYVYSGVSVITFDEFMKAESKGKYLNKYLKSHSFVKNN